MYTYIYQVLLCLWNTCSLSPSVGVDDSRKFQECLKVMKDIVLHALGIEKQGKGKMATLRDNTSHQKQISTSCQSSVSGKKLLTSTPPPGSRMSSGIGSIGEGEGSRDVSPLQQSHDSHMTSNHIQNIQDPLSSTPPINTVGVDRKQEVSSKKSPASVGTVQNSKQATSPVCRDPEGRRTSSRGVAGVEGKMDKLVQSEEQKRRLKMSVQELQIKVKEEEIRCVCVCVCVCVHACVCIVYTCMSMCVVQYLCSTMHGYFLLCICTTIDIGLGRLHHKSCD